MKRLIIDTSNILYRIAAVRSKMGAEETPEERANLALHMVLNTMLKYFNKYKPDKFALTFEGKQNWRKEWTADPSKNSSGKLYKANRVKDDIIFAEFSKLLVSFEQMIRTCTSIECLSHELLEGDDLFGGYVQKYCSIGDEVVGISGDKDYVQLLKFKNFTLINPDSGVKRTLTETCGVNDADYFLFEKCIRGDKGDNIFSAFPKVRKTKIEKAYKDSFEYTNFMNETWFIIQDDDTKKEFRVGDLFEENKTLISLFDQPDYIRELIDLVLEDSKNKKLRFNMFEFLKFCRTYKLSEINKNYTNYVKMLSIN